MNGSQLWLAAAALHTLVLLATCAHHRRIMATQATLPISKGGWRPVVGSNGLLINTYAAPQHAHSYKIPVPVLDVYPTSARPLVARETNKLTTAAQPYRATTFRNPASPAPAPLHQPISSYHNPFQNNGLLQNNALLQNNGLLQNGLSYYKQVQNFPLDSILIRNPSNPYIARPYFQKYPTKFKQQSLQNNVLQQLTSIQPIQFAQYQTQKPQDIFGKPLESYAKPTDNKHHSETEILKQEMYKLQDSDTAQQVQQVKTAQQQNYGLKNTQHFTYPQYTFQEALPSILGPFNSFGIQTVKGREPTFTNTKTTFSPQQSSKHTIFNSFSYTPNYKVSTNVFSTTTPRLVTTPLNQGHFSQTYTDYKITTAPSTKVSTPPKIDPNADLKEGGFKPSPNDPFMKYYQNDYNKVTPTTYNPIQTTSNNVYEYSYQAQNAHNNYKQQNLNYNFDENKNKVHDSVTAGGHQQPVKQYINSPEAGSSLHSPVKPTYEVVETTESDVITHSLPPSWVFTSQPNDYTIKTTEESEKPQEYTDYSRPNTTPPAEVSEEYTIVTEPEKGYENSLSYDGQVESQSRRPVGNDFEPIGKQRQKDYYSYRVSTPAYDEYSGTRRTKKPTAISETTTPSGTTLSGVDLDTLPTLPPSKHYKRPSTPLPSTVSQDKRKRNKIRRRRPTLAQLNRHREESSTRAPSPSTESVQTETTETHTIKPRVRPTSGNTTPTTTPAPPNDLTNSAVPTLPPTSPAIVKKKLIHRRPITTTPAERTEATTIATFKIYEASKESPIMKIANRQSSKTTSPPLEFKISEAPDYTHKQDEKDTPTSDVSVNLNDSFKTTDSTEQEFAFHKDLKPIDAKLEPVTNRYRETTTDSEFSNEVTTFAPRTENTVGKVQRPRLRNKYNRPKFSVKEYKTRLGSTTTTTEKPDIAPTKVRFPLRRTTESPYTETDSTTERKKFTPKDPRYKVNTDAEPERESYTVRQTTRHRQTTHEVESTTQKISSRIRAGNRRRPDESTESLSATTPTRRPLRKKVQDSEIGESVQELSVTDTTAYREHTSESAIMKIADKKHQEPVESLFERSKRVSDLTLAASKDYNKPGMFKSVSANSRRIPNYFTIATDDPILPIEAFFPQLHQKKEA